ncbi:unnamed protein product [Caenorhabditis auriculariae]|uniref:Dynein light chain n=1 Tax=Caenorhabditis auriculariae TaxID=2777116 RepID=A0A8S1HW48_9PELO|nr:unnamed protein product [Caenorhabditis auriculariae]
MIGLMRRKLSSKRRESRRWREPPEKALRAEDIVVKSTTMTEQRTQQAVTCLGDALANCGIENEIASFMKRKFDELHGSHWQCIVGRNFGSHLDTVEHVHLILSKISVLLFRCH